MGLIGGLEGGNAKNCNDHNSFPVGKFGAEKRRNEATIVSNGDRLARKKLFEVGMRGKGKWGN